MTLTQQRNARLPERPGIEVRVGVPHRAGRLAIECVHRNFPVMVSANAFWNARRRRLVCPDATPLADADVVLDSAGYTAMAQFKRRGTRSSGIAGIYPWTLSDHLSLVVALGGSLAWYSQADFACEPEIAADAEERDWRIRATATMLEATLRTVAAWQQQWFETAPRWGSFDPKRFGAASEEDFNRREAANLIRPPVPVLQGWTTDDYRKSVELMSEVWSRWEPMYSCALVGVGSVCRRSLSDPKTGIVAVVNAIDRDLPRGIKLHLFGVKSSALSALRDHPRIASVDSMAYDVRARVTAREAGMPNSMSHRVAAMNKWMGRQAERLVPSPQLTLPLASGALIRE